VDPAIDDAVDVPTARAVPGRPPTERPDADAPRTLEVLAPATIVAGEPVTIAVRTDDVPTTIVMVLEGRDGYLSIPAEAVYQAGDRVTTVFEGRYAAPSAGDVLRFRVAAAGPTGDVRNYVRWEPRVLAELPPECPAIAECGARECGFDPVCGVACGADCGDGFVCSYEGICEQDVIDPTQATGTDSGGTDSDAGTATETAGTATGGEIPAGMVRVPGGLFTVGGADVTLSDLFVDITEVTVAAYLSCEAEGVCNPAGRDAGCNAGVPERGEHPVNCVDQLQAASYCAWLGRRLPSEIEWEWVARGRELARRFPWGDAAPTCELAVFDAGGDGCGAGTTAPVGSRSPAGDSADGVQDLAGNVWEWTLTSPPGSSTRRVLRGGGWQNAAPDLLSTTYRHDAAPSAVFTFYGFRCVADPI
jgi:formylglycine-generating enzyme required for sulfatase activity